MTWNNFFWHYKIILKSCTIKKKSLRHVASKQQILESCIIQEVLSFLSWTLEKNKRVRIEKALVLKPRDQAREDQAREKKHVVSRVPRAWHWSRPLAEHVKQTMPFQLQSTVTAGLKEERKSHRGRSRYLGLYNEIKSKKSITASLKENLIYR